MAAVSDGRLDRRQFVKGGLAALGTAVVLGGCNSSNRDVGSRVQPSMRWAMLSDTHVPEDVGNNYRGFYPYRNLEAIVPRVMACAPDAVAITGDLARLTGQVGDYANLKKLLTPLAEQTPIFVSLGNHDDRDNFLRVFTELPDKRQPVPGKYVVVADSPAVRVIMLDSLFQTNLTAGLLGRAQRKWLAEYLRGDDEIPTVLCFHHTLSDGDGDLLDLPRLYDIVVPIRKVKAIVYGHSHVYSFSEYEGIHQINLPATGYNFSDKEPVGWVEAELTPTGGTFRLHATAGNKDHDGRDTRLTWRS